jgi:hypothetical protein
VSPEGKKSDAPQGLVSSIPPGSAAVNEVTPGPAIIGTLQTTGNCLMEAEQLNSISYKLDDLAQRAAELRRYL